MCGIIGIVARDQRIETGQLSRMAQAVSHRGPDDSGFYVDGGVGLGHTRLSIIDLSGGHQPLFNAEATLALVANGEIYNYIELREELIKEGCRFATQSDSETILHAYALYGRDFLRHLHGMFALALYDKARRRVLLARDRLGIKPLYYAVVDNRVVFGSEIKALLAVLPAAPEINPPGLAQFLQNQFNHGENCIIRGIRRLPPGGAVMIDGDLAVTPWQYWSAADVTPLTCTFEEACEAFDPLMERVVREHMRSDVPYGLFLSGGVDSGLLLAMLNRLHDRPLRTFSVGYVDSRMTSELESVDSVVKRFNVRHTPILLDPHSVFQRLVHTVWATDDLMRDYACLPTSFLAEKASQELKVVFTGEGGDEVFAGYGRYRQPKFQRFFKSCILPGSGGFRTSGQWRHRWVRRLFGPELTGAARLVRTPFTAAWQESPKSWGDLRRSQYTDMVTALPDNLLVKVDRVLMAWGLEGRVPYLDHRIVEFGLSLPDCLKVRSRQGKVFLRQWGERFLPGEYLSHRKRGFHVPVGEWLQGPFLAALSEKLQGNAAVRRWFNPQGVESVLRHQQNGGNASREVWCLMQFAIWHRLFVERPGSKPSPEENPLDWIS